MLIIWIAILVFVFYLLAKICDEYFVESLDYIIERLKLPSDVAGATFMAIGSSAPELFISIIALTTVGAQNIGAGTIVGSAIFNILVIVGASAIVTTVVLKWQPVIRDLLFYLVSIILLVTVFWDGVITLPEVSLFIVVYVVYLIVLAYWKRMFPETEEEREKSHILDDVDEETEEIESILENLPLVGIFFSVISRSVCWTFPNLKRNPHLYMVTFLVSIVYIAGLSWILVEAALNIAHILNVSEAIIALTVLAGGTSIPDMISSIIVAKRGRGGMAISNAVGSNTFDILVGLGAPWFVYILITGGNVVVGTENLIASMLLLLATVIVFLFILIAQKFKLVPKAGYFLIFLYILYLIYAIAEATGNWPW